MTKFPLKAGPSPPTCVLVSPLSFSAGPCVQKKALLWCQELSAALLSFHYVRNLQFLSKNYKVPKGSYRTQAILILVACVFFTSFLKIISLFFSKNSVLMMAQVRHSSSQQRLVGRVLVLTLKFEIP